MLNRWKSLLQVLATIRRCLFLEPHRIRWMEGLWTRLKEGFLLLQSPWAQFSWVITKERSQSEKFLWISKLIQTSTASPHSHPNNHKILASTMCLLCQVTEETLLIISKTLEFTRIPKRQHKKQEILTSNSHNRFIRSSRSNSSNKYSSNSRVSLSRIQLTILKPSINSRSRLLNSNLTMV